MKRTSEDVVGRPRYRASRRDVAGLPIRGADLDVVSFRHALDDPMGTAREEAELMADFADFMSGGTQIENAEVPPPDPVFREQLRRRLWRTHAMTNLRNGGETH
jgi:hypothetical protein